MPLPNIPSYELVSGFLLLAMALAAWWMYAVGRAYAASSGKRWNATKALISLSIALAWCGVLFGVSQQNWAHEFDSFPPPGLRVFIVLMAITTMIAFSSIGRQLATELPMVLLVGFQVFRLPTFDASLSGTLVYPDAFWRTDSVGLR